MSASDYPHHVVLARRRQDYLRWRNANARHPTSSPPNAANEPASAANASSAGADPEQPDRRTYVVNALDAVGESDPPPPVLAGGVGSAVGFLAGTAMILAAAVAGAPEHPALGLALLAVPALAVATLTRVVASAAQCWSLWVRCGRCSRTCSKLVENVPAGRWLMIRMRSRSSPPLYGRVL